MTSKNTALKDEYLEEFITGLQGRILDETLTSAGDETHIKEAATAFNEACIAVLSEVRSHLKIHNDLTEDTLQSILKSATTDQVASEQSLAKTLNQLSAKTAIESLFKECAALQNNTSQQYIEEKRAALLEREYTGDDSKISAYGEIYLRKLDAFKNQANTSPRDIFRRADIETHKTLFENEVAAKYGEIGEHLLKMKCQEALSNIAEKHDLPMPDMPTRH